MNDHDDMIEHEPEELGLVDLGAALIAHFGLPLFLVYHIIGALVIALGAVWVYRLFP